MRESAEVGDEAGNWRNRSKFDAILFPGDVASFIGALSFYSQYHFVRRVVGDGGDVCNTRV